VEFNLTKQDYEFILNNSTDGVTVCDLDGKFTFFNEQGERLLGIGDMEVESKEWTDTYGIFNPITKELFPNEELPLIMAINGKCVVGCEMFIKNKNNKEGIYLNVNAAPLVDRDKKIIGGVCIFHDITDKVNKRNVLLESNEHLKDFASSVAHDINSPLTAAIGLVNVLESMLRGKITEKEMDLLKRADRKMRRVSNLSADLLDYSKPSERKIQTIDLNIIASDVCSDLEDWIKEKNIKITINPLPNITTSQVVFRKVLQNIIENSIKYRRRDADHTIELSVKESDKDNILILIKDNGMGFNNEDSELIFSPLTRVHTAEDISGSGLGLSICRKLLRENQCDIWGASKEEVGAEFYISIPKKKIA
jgi:PAS domain S-box-containing protein